MKIAIVFILSLLSFCACSSSNDNNIPPSENQQEKPDPFDVGFSIGISAITPDTMENAKKVGIKCIEASGMGIFFDKDRNFAKSDAEATRIMERARNAADKAGVQIWSIHMPFGAAMDLSTIDEAKRQKVVEGHKKLLQYLKILQPKIILFHPSYYIEAPFRRAVHISQLIKSVNELNKAVQDIGATMVLENMLGPELMKGDRQRPLMRTVPEIKQIYSRLPSSIGIGVDLNHIAQPEDLLLAMGSKVKTLHVADGTGRAENHWMPHPCSGLGENDWNKIQDALYQINYSGPFLYETSDYNSLKQLTECYKTLYDNYVLYLNK